MAGSQKALLPERWTIRRGLNDGFEDHRQGRAGDRREARHWLRGGQRLRAEGDKVAVAAHEQSSINATVEATRAAGEAIHASGREPLPYTGIPEFRRALMSTIMGQ